MNQLLLTYCNYNNRATVILVLPLLPQEVSDRLQKQLHFRARVIGALASIPRKTQEKLRAFCERLHWLQSMATNLGVGFSAAQLWTLVREADMTDFEATNFSTSARATITSYESETGEQSATHLGTLYSLWNTFASKGYFAENATPRPPALPRPPEATRDRHRSGGSANSGGAASVGHTRSTRQHLLSRALAVLALLPPSGGGHGPGTLVFPQPTSRLGGEGRRPLIGLR